MQIFKNNLQLVKFETFYWYNICARGKELVTENWKSMNRTKLKRLVVSSNLEAMNGMYSEDFKDVCFLISGTLYDLKRQQLFYSVQSFMVH